ncbi:MAG: hypothetical protein COW84_09965 [Gammaproteobacteria bacterium CG22_combo_CG10-13_8_21_14_all_40_8]|nr:MAG: hypothetical protein COW84_09965 [Gammaproteobacteria bacterium CG22_combo_CG10-13_8_21_14_all_40_8]
MHYNPEICIMLATFNGESFLAEQIDSIREQTYTKWILLVRDDGSHDNTNAIISTYSQLDSRIRIVSDDTINRNKACGNFSILMTHAKNYHADIFMCCDQDDIWLPQKIERQLQEFEKYLPSLSSPRPLLVHSDLEVVNDDLSQIAPSFIQYMALKPKTQKPLISLFTQNMVTGCTMAFNRALLDICLPIPKVAIMHDWWLAMTCALHGEIIFIDETLVRYRQHSTNTIGAQSYWRSVFSIHQWMKRWKQGNQYFYRTLAQAQTLSESLAENNKSKLFNEQNNQLLEFVTILKLPRISRLKSMLHLKLAQANWLTNVVLVVRLLILSPLE